MYRISLASFLALPFLFSGTNSAAAMDAETLAGDEQTLRSAKLDSDGPALLAFFKSLTLTDGDREQIGLLIKRLGDKSFKAREKAADDLVALGPKAIPLVKPALKDPDLEIARRAETCLLRLEHGGKNAAPTAGPALVISASRLIADRKPAGAVDVLMAYLPYADQEEVVEEMQKSLTALAMRAGKPEPVLVKALSATDPLSRGIAGAALAGVAEHKNAVHQLLRDTDAGVRLRVGLALANAREKPAVPVLIELLALLAPEQAWPIEDLLRRLAEDRAPTVSLGLDAPGRKKCRDAWASWWRERGDAVAMPVAEASRRGPGYTLIVTPDYGSVEELGRDGKRRWQITGLASPFHAEVLPGDRVLIAEYTGRVTERNLKGEILFQVAVPMAMQCQRLVNGNTFIVTPNFLLEVNPAGKEVWKSGSELAGINILAARKLRSGHLVVMDGQGVCKRLDAEGKLLQRFTVGTLSNNCMEILPNGNVLVSRWFDAKVTEYDRNGKVVRELQWPSPFSANRIANGHTIIACQDPPRVVELDRAGKLVWEHKGETLNHRPWYANRR